VNWFQVGRGKVWWAGPCEHHNELFGICRSDDRALASHGLRYMEFVIIHFDVEVRLSKPEVYKNSIYELNFCFAENFSTIEFNRLMLFRETVAVYCENHTEHTYTLDRMQYI
jgi:hypothetical protein